MIEIIDNGILLHCHKYSYNKYIAVVLTENHGKVSGFTRKLSGTQGSLCNIHWKARLAEHLGNIHVEVVQGSVITQFWHNICTMCAINAILMSAKKFLPEGAPNIETYCMLKKILEHIDPHNYLYALSKWDIHIGEKYLGIDTKSITRDINNIKDYVQKYYMLNTKAKLDLAFIM